MTSRRTFLSLLGMTPIAAKATVDAKIAEVAGAFSSNGLGDSSIGLRGFNHGPPSEGSTADVPYQQRLITAARYVKLVGIPEVMEFEMREQARYVTSLDPDIACKQTWSMSVKIMTQRQRNYQRSVENVHKSGWQQEKRNALKKVLGFEWPW